MRANIYREYRGYEQMSICRQKGLEEGKLVDGLPQELRDGAHLVGHVDCEGLVRRKGGERVS